MALEQDIRDQVSAALGADLVIDEVSVTPAGRRRVTRITVERRVDSAVGDTPVEPLTLDEIADATRVVSDTLDSGGTMGEQPYTLEVSTPGTDRRLREPMHFRRAVDRLVELTLRGVSDAPQGAAEEVTGRVLATTPDGLDLHVKGTKKKPPHTRHVPFADITKGVVQVEFTRRPTPSTDDTEA